MAEQIKQESVEKLKELVEGVDFCMLTTFSNGRLRSRPMSTQKLEQDGELWFFTNDNSLKIDEIEADNRVNCAYSKPDDNTYISVSGTATVSKDRAKIEELWSPILKAWFPDGLDDPTLCLLKVQVEEAEYWEASSSTLVQLAGFVKAMVTGKEMSYGEHGKINP